MKLLIETTVSGNYLQIFSRFNVTLFKALTPPLTSIKVQRFDGCAVGDEVHLEVKLLNMITQKWQNKITSAHQNESEVSFTDCGTVMPAPLISWKHIHTIRKINETESVIVDDIDFSSGSRILDQLMYPVLFVMFNARKPVYLRELS